MPKDELIAALEAATGPDRELDARIWCYINDKKYLGHGTPYGERDGLFVQVEYTSPPKRTRQITNNPHTPHARCYTASIDAALTLVPDGMRVSLDWPIGEGSDPTHAQANLDRNPKLYGAAATPALAIVIAALRATERGEAGR